ncbi:MAG: glycosyltransferase [Flavobacteriales bacterium]|nr:glycosyltransferase [Flavobacteriales bacterium]
MSWSLISALSAFALASVHALVLDQWRRALAKDPEDHDTLPDAATSITVIVPARDAGGTLIPLLQDLHAQDLPGAAFEVLVVDDHSTDGTARVVRDMMHRWPGLKYLALADTQGKKAALEAGVAQARGDLIVVTDADVRCGPRRLAAIARHWATNRPAMLLLPVHTTGGRGFLAWLQRKEQLALQGVALGSARMGSPLLANGANMAFAREAFLRVGGYTGDRWASGDDMSLLARMRAHRWPVDVLVDREAAVRTAPERTWWAFFAQRLRWAGKMRGHRAIGGTVTSSIALLFPWALAVLTWWAISHVQVGQGLFYTSVLIGAAWLLWSLPIIRLEQASMRSFRSDTGPAEGGDGPLPTLVAMFLFTLYAPVIAVLSIFVRPTWKGRRV